MAEKVEREQTVGKLTGLQLAAVNSAKELLGDWEMRFGGPGGSDRVQWQYRFHDDGSVDVGDEQWRWNLGDDGSLTLASSPAAAGEVADDGASDELMYAYRSSDGRLVLANDDSSLIELLTKLQ